MNSGISFVGSVKTAHSRDAMSNCLMTRSAMTWAFTVWPKNYYGDEATIELMTCQFHIGKNFFTCSALHARRHDDIVMG